jgi:hypothetical protein
MDRVNDGVRPIAVVGEWPLARNFRLADVAEHFVQAVCQPDRLDPGDRHRGGDGPPRNSLGAVGVELADNYDRGREADRLCDDPESEFDLSVPEHPNWWSESASAVPNLDRVFAFAGMDRHDKERQASSPT